ncbi:MAG TPA: class A beta-lactamase [Novosphingobium sp.]|nr:class A beta-lactamase [Novosphingobium sp.]
MKTKFISKLLGSLTLAGVALVPAGAAFADTSLEAEFDRAFVAPAPAPASRAKPATAPGAKTQPLVQSTAKTPARPPRATVRPFVAYGQPRTFASGFEAQLYNAADASNGRIGVAVVDLTSGRTVSVLGDVPFPMASTSKVAIAATFLDGVDKGKWSLDDQFPVMLPVKSAKYSSDNAPVRPGKMMTGRQLIQYALIYSSNSATDGLLAAVGGPQAVNRWLASAGVEGMRIDRDIATLVRDDGEYNPATLIDSRDSATPLAMTELLSGLFQGKWLSPSSRAFLLSTMERCETGKRRMRALLPGDARVAHKTGTLNNTASDVGIIQAPDGHAYAVAIYVTGQGGKPNRDAKIAAIAQTIYFGNENHQGGSSLVYANK